MQKMSNDDHTFQTIHIPQAITDDDPTYQTIHIPQPIAQDTDTLHHNIHLPHIMSSPVGSAHELYSKLKPYTLWLFLAQIILLFIVVITSIVNLSLGNGDGQLWTALLSSSIGYILPPPSLKFKTLER